MSEDDYLTMFKSHLEELDRSPMTIKNYLSQARIFIDWFKNTTKKSVLDLPEVTPWHIKDYRKHIIDLGATPGTVNSKLICVRAFFNWAMSCSLIAVNPSVSTKFVKQVDNAPQWLDRSEQYAVLRTLDQALQLAMAKGLKASTKIANRNKLTVILMLNCGLRVSELISLKWSDIELNERSGTILVRYGKGGKGRAIPLNLDARQALTSWSKLAGKTGYVLSGKSSLGPKVIQHHVANIGHSAGIDDKLKPHILRHTFGKNLVDQGVPLDQVSRLLGHRNVNTTSIYTVPSQQDLARAVDMIAIND